MEIKTGRVSIPNPLFKDEIPVPVAEEQLSATKVEFRQLAKKGEVNHDTVLKGWQLYEEIDALRERVAGRMKGASLPIVHIMNTLEGINSGETSSGHRQFGMDTYFNGYFGEFFEGENLEPFEVENVKKFCEAMNSVGSSPGDMEYKFPVRVKN